MKNNVMGKKITRTYFTNCGRNNDGEITAKPFIKSRDDIEWTKILSFDGNNIRANNHGYSYCINISEDEEVKVINDIFRADLNEMMIYTSKEISIVDLEKEKSEEELKKLIAEYNKQEIEKDEKLLSYCKLHKLNIDDLELDELKKIVYPDKTELYCVGSFDWSKFVSNAVCYTNTGVTIL